MKWLLAMYAASLVAAASVNACGWTSNDAPTARAPDASIDEAVRTPDASPDAVVGPCGPFEDPDAAAASCAPAEQATRWATMLTQPIVPPLRAAGLDLRGPNGVGLTIAEAEQTLCAAQAAGPDGGAGAAAWGANDDVVLHVGGRDGEGNVVRSLTLTNGYRGAIDFASADRQHAYRMAIGDPITKDGAPFSIDWPSPTHFALLDELLRAMAATFVPSLSLPTGAICSDMPSPNVRHCRIASWGDETWVWYETLGVVFWIADRSAPEPAASTPFRFDVFAPPMPCDAPGP